MNFKRDRVAVIGAGPAGATAAYVLTKCGIAVDIYEASPFVGGLSRTIDLWGQRVDLGPHRFFSSDARVNNLWLEIVGNDYDMVDRLTRIYYKDRFFQYPLKPLDALAGLGLFESARCLASFAVDSRKPAAGDSFEDWVVNRFGRRLFEIFFKTYSEKLWGIPCTDLDADFAAQRIKKLSLWEAVKNSLTGGSSNTHKTLVDQFAYPHGGTGMVYERMAHRVAQGGGKLLTSTPVKRVVVDGGRVVGIELSAGTFEPYDHVVSTMPLSLMADRLDDVPDDVRAAARSLKFRNTILVYLKVEAVDLFPDQWLYVHSGELRMGRITNFRNWTPHLHGADPSTILAVEYWCNDTDARWTESDDSLISMAIFELRQTGLIGNAAVADGYVHRISRCYPVYARGYKSTLEPVQDYLSTVRGLSVIGRYGAFKYNNQDHSILMGLLAAENIAGGAAHNLWDINTDYETYQETSVITRTGLGRTVDIDSAEIRKAA